MFGEVGAAPLDCFVVTSEFGVIAFGFGSGCAVDVAASDIVVVVVVDATAAADDDDAADGEPIRPSQARASFEGVSR